LQLEEGEKLGNLLTLLSAELHRRTGIHDGVANFGTRQIDADPTRVASLSTLSEREVDQLLGNRRLLEDRLRELHALEVAAEAWGGVLAELRGELARQSENGSARRKGQAGRPEAGWPAHRYQLCEADDEYWYL
jgi:hypothetical protein